MPRAPHSHILNLQPARMGLALSPNIPFSTLSIPLVNQICLLE
jgi:hypothetical protein